MVVTRTPSAVAAQLDHDQLVRDAIRVLIENWHGHATVPSRRLYPHQWSWDSAFIALGQQHVAPQRAAVELLSLFGAQWADGRIPHIAFNPAVADDAYFPGPSFWRSSQLPGHPPVDTSGIIQPPVHAIAALAVMDRLGGEWAGLRRSRLSGSRCSKLLYPRTARGRWARRSRAPMGDRPRQFPGLGRATARGAGRSRSSTPTRAAILIMRGPASAQPMRTMRATSG